MADALPPTWKSGATDFETVEHNNMKFAVVKGKTLADVKYVFKIKIADGKPYFINAETKQKAWELPDCCPAGSGGGGGGAASSSSPAADSKATQNAAGAAGGSSSSDAEIVERVRAMYTKYNPSKLSDIDTIVKSYEGKHEKLIASLVSRYGPEPSAEERAQISAAAAAQQPPAIQAQQQQAAAAAAAAAATPQQQQQQQQAGNNNINNNSGPASLTTADAAAPLPDPSSPSFIAVNTSGTGPASPTSSSRFANDPNYTYRDRVVAIYQKYAPEKTKNADKQLRQYEGHEEALIQALVAKFGPEPPKPDKSQQSNNNLSAVESLALPPVAPSALSAEQQQQQDEAAALQQRSFGNNGVTSPLSANNNNNSAAAAASSPPRDLRTTSSQSEPAPLPVPRAAVVTVDLPPMPSTPSPIFDTTKLLQAPASVRQELLMSFLADRDNRLKEALDRNERFVQVIQQLQQGHDALTREVDTTRRTAQQEQEAYKTQLREAQNTIDSIKHKWSEEKERSSANQEVNKLQAQRDIHSQLVALEEAKIQYGKEISDLKSKLSVSSHASKAVREEATALLSVLARKEEQMRAQQEELNRLQVKLQGPVKITTSTQTQESLSDIIRSVAKHMGGGGDAMNRSKSAEAEHLRDLSAQMVITAKGERLPLAQPNSCQRCQRGAAISHCSSCKLNLCHHCDHQVHDTANRRFQMHRRVVIAIAANDRSISSQMQQQQQQSTPSRDRSVDPYASQQRSPNKRGGFGGPGDETLSLLPDDIDQQLASGMDNEIFDRIISQFDDAFAAKRSQRNEEVDRLRNQVKDLEDSISKARGASSPNRTASGSAGGGATSTSRSVVSAVGSESEQVNQIRLQVDTEQRRNQELAARCQELEMLLLASPEHDDRHTSADGAGEGGCSRDEKKQLEMHIAQLQKELTDARMETKDKRKEITELRSLLSAHMSSPFGVVRSPGGKTPPSAKMHF